MSCTNMRNISSSSTIATPTRPSGTASGFEVPLCRCGGPGEDAPGECDGFMNDEALECLRRKMITGRFQPSDKLEQDSQGPIFNLYDADIHALALETQCPRSILRGDQENSSAAQDALNF